MHAERSGNPGVRDADVASVQDGHPAQPRYSVVIPAWQAASTLEPCLRSITCFRPQGTDIILVDDGSTDDTAAIAGSFDVTLVRLARNSGAAAARNHGIEKATGGTIVFLDADVVIDEGFFPRLDRLFLGNEQPDAVVGMFAAELGSRDFPSLYKHHQQRSYHLVTPRRTSALFTAVSAVKTTVLHAAGLFDQRIGGATMEDVELGQRIVDRGFTIIFDPAVTVRHLKSYTWTGLIKTQWSRARGMGQLFRRRNGSSQVVRQGRFSSIPLTFGFSLLLGPLTLLMVSAALVEPLPFIPTAAAVWSVMLLTQRSFLLLMNKHGGIRHGFLTALVLPLDFSLCAIAAVIGWLRPGFQEPHSL